MANIPQKVAERLVSGVKKFQPILTLAQSHDANESDTVIIITDILSELFGYDKYSEITSEKGIRGTFCDLATKVDDVIQSFIEAKAINQELKEGFVKQAVDYAVNGPVDWVIRAVIQQEVLKREVVECEKAAEARKRIARATSKALRNKSGKDSDGESSPDCESPSQIPSPINPG